MLLTVIIPVYDVENTLDKCVSSVLTQGIMDMEVILVDDESPGKCSDMCDEWACRDKRIRVIHQVNGGLSAARNAGIDRAAGEYITFVDSDDILEQDTYKPLITWLKEHGDCDILEFPVRHAGGNRISFALRNKVFASARQYWEETKAWQHAYAWNKIYRRKLFEDVRFPEGKFFEDIFTLPRLLSKEPKIATTSHGTYIYVWNECGISRVVSREARGLKQHMEALLLAAKTMGTTLLSRNGWSLYYAILCRQIDLYKLTGEVVLPWPMVRLICRTHKFLKQKS